MAAKRPESVLVVIYTRTGRVLLLQRADAPDFWQSVTGSLDWDETSPRAAAERELFEETGLVAGEGLRDWRRTYRFEIFQRWRHRYAPGITENIEHVFSLELPAETAVNLNPDEHAAYEWLGFREAAARTGSWSNRAVIEELAATHA